MKFDQWFTLTRPQRWDVDHPQRYRVHTEVQRGGRVCDVYETPFGIREIIFTPSDGMYLNGRRLQLNGVCLHHDQGPLGAKIYKRALERQLEIMKSMGVNAVRNSHNIAAPELLDLCDSMGILVFDEAYDKWDRKADILPDADFHASTARNIANFVRRDRNHPCVFVWSVGNEMPDVQGNTDDGLLKLEAITGYVLEHDRSRPLTIASDNMGGVVWRHFDYYDIHSWNYGRRYLPARHLEPNKPVIISESASTVSTRGFYEWPLPKQKTDFSTAGQVSSYDMNAPAWAEIPDDDFMWQEEDRYVCGEFVWTGFDYLGEPTPYDSWSASQGIIRPEQTAKSSYFGIVDLCGIPKDRYYLYKSLWLPDYTTVHLLPHWNWAGQEGQQLPVMVYTNGDAAELFLNGKSLGKKAKNPVSSTSWERYRLVWPTVTYAPGTLKAVAYKGGKKIGETQVQTADQPSALRLTPDRSMLTANGEDLSYILVEAIDQNGNLCPNADFSIQFDVQGAGRIEGVGNGNPQSLESFVSDKRKLFFGKAMLIVRSSELPGKINVKASAGGLKTVVVELEVE
ncbi:MAG: DUF4982 domain-containing protein [Lewinellaceae bacterium]|nr:DUF4982 domain-containing protein [Lewinellaceae bacterium]